MKMEKCFITKMSYESVARSTDTNGNTNTLGELTVTENQLLIMK